MGRTIFLLITQVSVLLKLWNFQSFAISQRLEAYSAHYRRKRLVGHFVRLLRCVKEGKLKRAPLKPLVVKHEPVGVPPEYLHRLPRLTEKDKNPTSERRLAHLLGHKLVQPVYAKTHVHIPLAYVITHPFGQPKHGSPPFR